MQATYFQGGSQILSDLKMNSPILRELEVQFEALKVQKGLRVMNFLETRGSVRPSAFCNDLPRIHHACMP